MAVVDIGDEEVQRRIDARQVLTRITAAHVVVGAHAEEHRIVLIDQFLERKILADLGVENELDTHLLEHLTTALDDGLFQLELGDAEGQQTTNLRVSIVDGDLDAVAGQYIGTRKPRRTCTDHRHTLAAVDNRRKIGFPAIGKGGITNVKLDRADSYRAKAIIQGTVTFTQALLRADTTGYLGQGIGLVRKLHRLLPVAFIDQLQPVGNVVVHRALPLAIGVAAVQAAPRLGCRGLGIEAAVDLRVLLDADIDGFLLRALPGNVQKL